ncbi:MAG: hypothetical protein PHD06_13070 [Bacteroidales bacterium]|jgi:hypothetical protein|nr:hypothetical protein [Bacteroidales bacterium]MDD4386099.1 hypothetical protein [Bacteroidales bacterium]MDY0196769.1 hypothetical protein [Tenuifilaceae bacterium]
MLRKLSFIALLAITGCVSKSGITSSNHLSENSTRITVEVISLNEGNSLQFNVINNSDDTLYFHNYSLIHIEKNNKGDWEKLRILPCPCGASCPRPFEYVEIPKGQLYSLMWDKQESWCEKKGGLPVPETKYASSSSGEYRIKIVYSFDKKDVKEFFENFTL